ncbi:hypothetical protein BRADI_5g18370v3 [Brachypodium distachyon]|uniref:Polygalacturonase n=1 Tax=Brachypodium distachyon TaxID=15368 RepID=A0A0Q3ECD1_BRADI|nr:hypothetical protein BRADI_5g18370v3 [Brachypodium distachyon]
MGLTIIGVRTAILLLLACLAAARGQERAFSVVNFGARGDGTTDDTKAFEQAWAATCGARGPSATLHVPANRSFLVGPTTFHGPCTSARVTVQVLGTITAPPSTSAAWKWSDYWLMFQQVRGLTVTGGSAGVLDGRGQTWWPRKCKRNALKLVSCDGLELSYLSSKDSPQMHIVVSTSRGVNMTHLTITAPGDSPNTDGIHLDRSEGVQITGSTIGTGDDCVSIGSGTRFVTVDGLVCGPGHGVSVGSLGRKGSNAAVEYIDVRNVHFINTSNGARIKTWLGGQGYARSISFTDIKFTNVDHPVVINQFYVDRAIQSMGGVAIRNITYTNLNGTSSQKTAVAFDCSESGSCTGIHVNSMAITGTDGQATVARCQNVQGDTSGNVSPHIPCLG